MSLTLHSKQVCYDGRVRSLFNTFDEEKSDENTFSDSDDDTERSTPTSAI